MGSRSGSHGVLCSVLLALFVGAAACRKPASEAPSPTNLVILLTDTLRADRAEATRPAPVVMPAFERFAERNFRFLNATSPTSWTRPAVASLFTGLYPQRHGVQMRQDRLADSVPTLAGLLAEQGFDTVVVTTNPHVAPTWGLTRGFSRVVELMPDPDRLKHGNDAAAVLEAVQRVLLGLRQPFFLYVHLIDPHAPYEPPAEDLAALGHTPAAATIVQRYDGEVHFADRHVGQILTALQDRGLDESTIVVLTADHGEELYEHGALGHGDTLFEEVVRVPLALRVPPALLRDSMTGGRLLTCPRIRIPVSLVDLVPTLMPWLGVAAPPSDGRDVGAELRCEALPPAPLFFSLDKERASLAAVRWGEHKLLVDRATGARRLFALPPEGGELPVEAAGEVLAQSSALLDAFERSAQPGLHLVLAGQEGVQEQRQVELALETNGRFTHARGLGLEPTDRFELVAGGRLLWASVQLRSVWHRAPKRMWAQDRDELLFGVEPPGATVELTVKVDGRWADLAWLRQPRFGGAWPLRVTVADLVAAPTALVDRRASGVYLFARERAAAEKVEAISAELAAALAALGYVQ